MILFFALTLTALGATLPLTVKEISLMLRSGYSLRAVEDELTVRHFAETLDESKRKQLKDAGASAELLDEIQNGKYNAPKDELERARRKQEETEERALAARIAPTPRDAAKKSVATYPADVIAQAVKGNLVRDRNGLLVSYNDEDLNRKKIYALYFSAHWCPPCRKFTPQLVAWYQKVAADHPELEIIFISSDKTPEAMAAYVRDAGMPWPAIDYAKIPTMASLLKYAGDGIPDLVFVDASGKVLADSYAKGKYAGPTQALKKAEQFFASEPAIATR